jgi:hypothetical protein
MARLSNSSLVRHQVGDDGGERGAIEALTSLAWPTGSDEDEVRLVVHLGTINFLSKSIFISTTTNGLRGLRGSSPAHAAGGGGGGKRKGGHLRG